MSTWLLTFIAALGISAGSATGQSRLIFPRLSFEEATLTGVAVLNPNSTSAMVTFTAYNHQGQVLAAEGFENPRQITIEAGRQFADVTASIFGTLPPETVGWFEGSSDSSDLTGFFLYLNFPDFVFFDGADLPRSDTRLIFPDVRLAEGFQTEINLVNPGTDAASVQLILLGEETEQMTDLLEIPTRGVLRLDIAEVFTELALAGVGAFPEAAILSVISTEEVAGFAFVRQAEGDLLGLNAVPVDELLNRLYFPQLAVGEIIRTELSLDNLSGQDTLVTLTAHREDGEPFGPGVISTNPVTLALEAGEVMRLDMAETFGFVGNEVRQGWLEVAASREALHGALSYTLPGTGSLAAVATSRQGSRQAAFSHLATDQGFFTGLALLNPSTLAVDLRIVAISQAGEILGTVTRTLAPGERISQLLGVDLIPQAAGQSGGVVYVRSSVPIYLTSLFGRVEGSGVLANIPAQPVPTTYRPDEGLPQARVNPPLAAVEPGGSLSFMLQMGEDGMPSWKVNGIVGGSAQVGTISTGGIFQAPSASPMRLPLSITAEIGDQAASASVDVISRQVLVAGLGLVQSVAYLEGLERLYVAELGIGGASTAKAQQGTASVILDVTGGNRMEVRQIPGEDVAKILAYRQANGRESLLVAGRGTGQIYRLDVEEPFELALIASGLNAPVAMALDFATGDLLVAEADKLSRIAAARLSADGPSAQGPVPGGSSLLEEIAPRGLAVDSCTGDIYFSDGEGQSIRRLERGTGGVTTVVELTDPTQLLGILRSGVSCPDGFHLLVAEPMAGQVTRVVPEQGLASLYAAAPGVQDVVFLPAGAVSGSEGVLVAEQGDGGGQVEQILVSQIYQTETINPPDVPACSVVAEIPDQNLEAAVRQALGLGPSEPITCALAEGLTNLDAQGLGISRLDGLEEFVNLQFLDLGSNQSLDLTFNQISDVAPLAGLTNLRTLRLDRNQISDISPLAELSNLQSLSLQFNQISEIAPLAGLTNLQSLSGAINQISDIAPLAGLTKVQSLNLSGNQISEIAPLAGLTNLQSLVLSGNQISEIAPLAGLTNLQSLVLSSNQISDIAPLAGLTNLQFLTLVDNSISDIAPVAGLTNLQFLNLNTNQISDISALAGLINLQTLLLSNNQISDLGPLVTNMGLGQGDSIGLSGNLLDAGDCASINALVARGVAVDIAAVLCP